MQKLTRLLLGAAAVVPYACTGKLVSVLANQPQAILQSAAPALSELRTTNDRSRLFQVSSALARRELAPQEVFRRVVDALPPAWQYPEDAITHFHGYDDGFAGRMKIV